MLEHHFDLAEDILSRSNRAVKPGLMVQERDYPGRTSNRLSTIEANGDHKGAYL